METCSDCHRPPICRGLCKPCYGKRSRAGTLPERQPRAARLCTAPDCDRKHYSLGLCIGHYQQHKRGQPPVPLHQRKHVRYCDRADCERVHAAKGLCKMHYKREQRMIFGLKRRGPKPKLRAEAPQRKPKPRGTQRPFITGRLSPSPFADAPRDRRKEQAAPMPGWLPGSERHGHLFGSLRNLTRLHEFECEWVDMVDVRAYDLWHHPKVGFYVLRGDPIAPERVKARPCKLCGSASRFQGVKEVISA